MKILYVAPLRLGNTSLHRLQALKDLGHELTCIDIYPEWLINIEKGLPYRIFQKIFGQPDLIKLNLRIIQEVSEKQFDLVWIDKGLIIKPDTLRKVRTTSPETIVVGYSPDDIVAEHHRTKRFLKSLPYYHVFFIPRIVNVNELIALGCPKAFFIDKAYDPQTHRPMQLSPEEKARLGGPVGFIGSYEEQRAESICYLAQQGVQVGIWGNGWEKKFKLRHPNIIIRGPSIYGDDYARAICSFDIVLGFLRKINRDLQTSRSFEIPACGAFMLAERTVDHLRLFEEGKEAEFFGSNQELLEKVGYYLKNAAARQAIARAGRERCLKSGYSNQERLKSVLKLIES
jgi:spore maturation protein CgeB